MCADAAVKQTTTVQRSTAGIRFTVCAAPSASCRMRRASGRNATPAGVSVTARVVRSMSWTPSSLSSCWICLLSGGCDMCSRSAARPKCSSSATATKQDSRASENTYALLASLHAIAFRLRISVVALPARTGQFVARVDALHVAGVLADEAGVGVELDDRAQRVGLMHADRVEQRRIDERDGRDA